MAPNAAPVMTVYLALFWAEGARLSGEKYASLDIADTIAFATTYLTRLNIRDTVYRDHLLRQVGSWRGDVLLQPTTDTGSFALISVDLATENGVLKAL